VRARVGRARGFSLIELLIVVTIILVIAAIAIPALLRSRISANDAQAISNLRTLNSAEVSYQIAFPQDGFSPSLRRLGPNGLNCMTGVVDFTHACLIDSELGCNVAAGPCRKSGFNYYLSNSAATAPVPDYIVAAGPTSWSYTGSQNICSGPDLVLRSSKYATSVPGGSITAAPNAAGCADPTAYGPLQ
jgi:type IV pilus assembly protein PilA